MTHVVEIRLLLANDPLAFHLPVNLDERPEGREYSRRGGRQNPVSVRHIERITSAVNDTCRPASGIADDCVSCIALGGLPSRGCFVTRTHPSRYRHNFAPMKISASIVDLQAW